jgi:hypothetical protein
MTQRRRQAVIALLAVLGVVLAAAITYGTSQLVRQRIGLASEPLSAGQTLVVRTPATRPRGPAPRGAGRTTRTSSPSAPAPAGGSGSAAGQGPSTQARSGPVGPPAGSSAPGPSPETDSGRSSGDHSSSGDD